METHQNQQNQQSQQLFDMSENDTDSDISNEINNEFESHIEYLNKLELKYYPEPYNSLGQFILSSIVGSTTSYILSLRTTKSQTINYHTYLDSYNKYCKNAHNDEYLKNLKQILKIDDQTESSLKFSLLMDNINKTSKEIMDNFIQIKFDSYIKYLEESVDTFSLEKLNSNIIFDVLPLIKFSTLYNLNP